MADLGNLHRFVARFGAEQLNRPLPEGPWLRWDGLRWVPEKRP